MVTKTYRAPNMLTALQEIQRDLGPDAMVVSMREIPSGPAWQVWSKPGVEVVATRDVPSSVHEQKSSPRASDQEQPIPGRKEIEAILEAIAAKKGFEQVSPFLGKEQLNTKSVQKRSSDEPVKWTPPVLNREEENPVSESTNQAVKSLGGIVDEILQTHQSRSAQFHRSSTVSTEMESIERLLLRQGLDAEFVEHLISTNIETLNPTVLHDQYRLQKYMMKQLAVSLRPQKNSMAVIQSRVMCIIGASGSGKTSTCAKLAAFYSHTLSKKVVWICADTIRAGAIAETRTYTDVIQVPLFFAYTPQELGETVREQHDADLIIIDTPGVNMLDESKVTEVGSFLNEVTNRSLYLTAPATTKLADLEQAVLTFQPFKLKGLIITKMDETYSYGDVYQLLQKTRLPAHYFTDGSQVLGKLHPGEPERIVAAMFGEGSVG